MVKNQFSYTKSKLLDLFDLEIRDVKKSEQSLFENKNILWKKTTKILYHTIADVYILTLQISLNVLSLICSTIKYFSLII